MKERRKSNQPYIAGIKVGNTNAALSYVDIAGEVNLISHSIQGKKQTTIPCFFCFVNGTWTVANEAASTRFTEPENVVRLNLAHLGRPAHHNAQTREHSQEQLLEKLFSQLIVDGITSIGFVDDSILSVPDYLNQSQRATVRQIAESKGFFVKRVIDHSEAILYGYGFPDFPKETIIVLVRTGGSSLTVRIVKRIGDLIEIISEHSNFELGTERWDEIIMHALANECKKVYGVNPLEDSHDKKELSKALQQAKNSRDPRGPLAIDYVFREKHVQVDLSNEEIRHLTRNFCEQLQNSLSTTIKESRITEDAIEHVLIGGGGARTPTIIDSLGGLSAAHIVVAERPEEIIVRGAASNGYYLKYGRRAQFKDRENVVEPPPAKTIIAEQRECKKSSSRTLSLLIKDTISKTLQFENENEISIGRGRKNTISFYHSDYDMISRKHAMIEYRDGTYYLTDMSTNGTFVNGVKLVKLRKKRLQEGNVIQIAPGGPILKVLSLT